MLPTCSRQLRGQLRALVQHLVVTIISEAVITIVVHVILVLVIVHANCIGSNPTSRNVKMLELNLGAMFKLIVTLHIELGTCLFTRIPDELFTTDAMPLLEMVIVCPPLELMVFILYLITRLQVSDLQCLCFDCTVTEDTDSVGA